MLHRFFDRFRHDSHPSGNEVNMFDGILDTFRSTAHGSRGSASYLSNLQRAQCQAARGRWSQVGPTLEEARMDYTAMIHTKSYAETHSGL